MKVYTNDISNIQLIQLRSIGTGESFLSDTNLHRCSYTNGLDDKYPYFALEIWPPVVNPNAPTSESVPDSPGHPLAGTGFAVESDAFQTYLLFWPYGGRPVPLKLASWSWGKSASFDTNSPTGYTLLSSNNPSGAVGAPCSTPPTWTNCISSSDSRPHWRTNDCPNP